MNFDNFRFIKTLFAIVSTTLVAIGSGAAQAETFPERPISIVAPYPAGGSVDAVARALAAGMTTRLHKQVIVENRPGAAGSLGGRLVASAKPDGYTLLLATDGSIIAAPLVISPAPYQLSAFTPISRFASAPLVLVARRAAYKDLPGFIDSARKKAGSLTMGLPGIGTPPHFMIQRLESATGIRVLHVPYKGGAPLMSDLLGGQIDAYFCTVANCSPQIRDGSMKALGIVAPTRSALLPSVPTFAEQGVASLSADNWFGLVAPSGLPAPVLATLESAVAAVTTDPAFKRQMQDAGIEIMTARPSATLKLAFEQERDTLAKLLASRPLEKQ